jgi:hypothetical protein
MSAVKPGDLPTERDTNMAQTYLQVIAIEAAVIALLWVFGRMFS